MAETTQKETQIKVRHWYGAARGMAIAFPLAFLLLALAVLVFAYLPLGVVVVSALIGWAIPGRPHHEKGAWRTVRESAAWLFAALHLVMVALWLYLATGFFGITFNSSFEAAVQGADRVVVRDGGGLCHSDPDKEPSLFEITNKVEIAAFNDMFKFSARTMPCMCCGYPGIDWWRDGQRVVVSALHHGHARESARRMEASRDGRILPRPRLAHGAVGGRGEGVVLPSGRRAGLSCPARSPRKPRGGNDRRPGSKRPKY